MEIYLKKSKITIRGLELGNPNGAVTLALHGWLDNCHSFKPMGPLLKYNRLIAVDLPGHGWSDHLTENIPYDFSQYVVWLYEFQQTMSQNPIHLIGHSLGAAIASIYAGTFPDLVSSLTLIDGLGPLSIDESEAANRFRTYIEAWHVDRMTENSKFTSLDAAVEARLKAGNLSRKSAEILASRGTTQNGSHVVWRHDPRLKLPSRYQFSHRQVLSYLTQITCPSLLIQGIDSKILQSPIANERMKAIPDLEHRLLKGAHHLHLDDPKESAETINQFFARINAS